MSNKLLEHFKRMQECAARYILPNDNAYIDRDGQSSQGTFGFEQMGIEAPMRNFLFANDMLYMLDGPEQREAQSEAELRALDPVGITSLYKDVREFHVTFGHPYNDSPTLQPSDRANARADWIIEEAEELREATTIHEQADAYIDALYFAVGGLVEIGVEPSRIWNLVHGANMAKVWPDGTVRKRDDGKIIKPDGWTAPDALIEAEIDRQSGNIEFQGFNVG